MSDQIENVEQEQKPDRRALLEAAVDAMAEGTPEAPEREEPEAEAEVEAEEVEEGEAAPEEEAVAEDAPEEEDLRAPASLTKKEREAWAEAPKELKRNILRRERDFDAKLRDVAPKTKFADETLAVFAPYAAELQALGVTPQAAMKDLMNTSYKLRRGSPEEKAQMAANILKNNGVDFALLNDYLGGVEPEAPKQKAQNVDVQAEVRKALEQQRYDAELAQAHAEIARFRADPKNEHIAVVEELMGSLANSKQYAGASIEQLYKAACMAHPDVGQTMLNKSKSAVVQKKLNASSSLKSTGPRVQAAQPKFASRREAIEAAMDLHMGKGRI